MFYFRSITRSYYHDSVGALLVYDITNRDSFNNLQSWLEEAQLHVAPRHIIFVLVGQKKDLSDFRKVCFAFMNQLLLSYFAFQLQSKCEV